MSKAARSDVAFYLVCAALAQTVATMLPVHDVYEIETREPSESWFYAMACGLEAANEQRLRARDLGTRFVVSGRFYEKDAECWVIRLAGSTEWIDVFVTVFGGLDELDPGEERIGSAVRSLPRSSEILRCIERSSDPSRSCCSRWSRRCSPPSCA